MTTTVVPIANQNWLLVSESAVGVNALSSAQYPQITTWSNATAYSAGQIVTNPADGLQYQALIANTGVQPPTPGTWARSAYTSPDKGLLALSAIPLPYIPPWDARTIYPPGAVVIYGSLQFTAPAGSTGVNPPTVPINNSDWEYVSAAQNGWTGSFYVVGSPYGVTIYAGIEWYDTSGKLIAVPSGMSPSGAVIALPNYQRLSMQTAEMIGTSGNVLGATWNGAPTGFWQVSAGLLFPNPSWSGSQKIKLLYVSDSRSDCCVGITCQSGVGNSAVQDTGILFRLSDTNNYWLCCRQKIQKMVAGTLTTVASFSRLPVGARMYVQLSGSTIRLYYYPGNAGAPVLVTTVTDSFNSTATSHGVYYQVY